MRGWFARGLLGRFFLSHERFFFPDVFLSAWDAGTGLPSCSHEGNSPGNRPVIPKVAVLGAYIRGGIVDPLNKQFLEPPSPGLLVFWSKFPLSGQLSHSFLLPTAESSSPSWITLSYNNSKRLFIQSFQCARLSLGAWLSEAPQHLSWYVVLQALVMKRKLRLK